MAKRIIKEDYINAYNKLNTQINSTLNNKLSLKEKCILYDFLYNKKEIKLETISEPFIKEIFTENNSNKFTQVVQDSSGVQDNRFQLPRIFSLSEEEYIRGQYYLKNSLSKVALSRVLLKFPKVYNIRTCYGTGKMPLRHAVLGRFVLFGEGSSYENVHCLGL